MKNQQKNAAQKTSVNTKNADAKNANSKKIVDLQLTQFAKKLESIEVKEKKDKVTLYIYPDGFSKTDINSEKGKKFRNSLRTKIQKFANNICVYAKSKQSEKLIDEIKEFDAHYKQCYRVNDYTLKSISSSNNEAKNENIELMLQIIQSVKTQIK